MKLSENLKKTILEMSRLILKTPSDIDSKNYIPDFTAYLVKKNYDLKDIKNAIKFIFD